MARLAVRVPDSRAVPVVRLAELPALTEELAVRVRAGGFAFDCVAYVETGARLLGHQLAGVFGVPVIPIWIRRSGHGLKGRLAPLAQRLPVAWRDALRKIEEASGVHLVTRRVGWLPENTRLAGRRVLLVDDAADTGRTIACARRLLSERGVAPADTCAAVLAATTKRAQAAVDVFVLDRNCRLPWSADSDEIGEATRRAEQLPHADAPSGL